MENRSVKNSVRYFLLSLLSRKFLLAIAGTIMAYDAAMMDGMVAMEEILLIVTPILGFMGVEGYADAKERAAK